jgi:hypothetical protein
MSVGQICWPLFTPSVSKSFEPDHHVLCDNIDHGNRTPTKPSHHERSLLQYPQLELLKVISVSFLQASATCIDRNSYVSILEGHIAACVLQRKVKCGCCARYDDEINEIF